MVAKGFTGREKIAQRRHMHAWVPRSMHTHDHPRRAHARCRSCPPFLRFTVAVAQSLVERMHAPILIPSEASTCTRRHDGKNASRSARHAAIYSPVGLSHRPEHVCIYIVCHRVHMHYHSDLSSIQSTVFHNLTYLKKRACSTALCAFFLLNFQ